MSMAYGVLLFPVLIGFTSFGVDVARVRLAKSELSSAVDAAARRGASYLPNGTTAVKNAAVALAALNNVDGSPLVLDPANDIDVGTWNAGTKTFTAGGGSPNAVKITGHRTASRGTGVPLLFASIIGISTCDISATATTLLTGGGISQTPRVNGIMNVYLAGMPNGYYGGPTDSGVAPDNSPIQVTGLSLYAGQILNFSSTGSTADDPANINQNWTPDGQPGGYRTNDSGYLNGMSQLSTQQASLVGVFLDDNAPTTGSTPSALNMNTPAAIDYTSLSPQLKQPFFIGDGKTSGGAQQQIVVPSGATRLFLGVHDNINWANNSGYLLVTINGTTPKISFAK